MSIYTLIDGTSAGPQMLQQALFGSYIILTCRGYLPGDLLRNRSHPVAVSMEQVAGGHGDAANLNWDIDVHDVTVPMRTNRVTGKEQESRELPSGPGPFLHHL